MYNSQSTVEMKDGDPFLFWNPLAEKAAIVCLSEKAGSTTWKLALLQVHGPYSVFDSSPHTAKRPKPPKDCPLWAGPSPRSYALVRNPYSRLLSGYLHLVARDYVGNNDDRAGSGDDAESFGAFVANATRKKGTSFEAPAHSRHFEPLTRKCGFGTTRPRSYDRVLRVEQIADWYDGFVCDLGLEAVVATGWNRTGTWFTGTAPCFYSPPGLDCEGRATTDGGHAAPASFHATRADARLGEFYGPGVAGLVTTAFRDDLARFAYPAWDGRDGAAYLARVRGLPRLEVWRRGKSKKKRPP